MREAPSSAGAHGSGSGSEATGEQRRRAGGQAGGLSWKVTPVPEPSYAAKPHVEGRAVHADTDIRGIPEVQAGSTPARPTHVSEPRGTARSSEDVAQEAESHFDLDAVLQARRDDDTGAVPTTKAVGLGGLHGADAKREQRS